MKNLELENLYQQTRGRLKQAGINNPDLVARVFIRESLGISDADLIAEPQRPVTEADAAKVDELVKRRLAGEPVSRILGEREFWGLPFTVTGDVLDPRPDSETLVEAALKAFKDKPPQKILDLGTGTGCILIALLLEWPQAEGVAVDISENALAVARINAQRNGVADRIHFVKSDWGENIDETFDLVVSNPPYIPDSDIESLVAEVKNHDPILALAGGNDGLDAYKKIFSQIFSLLRTGGTGLFEIGINQDEDVARLVENSGANLNGIHRDLAGIPRVVEISCGDK